MYCLLEHASHLIQPLDLGFFAILKENWTQEVRDFQIQNIPETVTKKNFASVFRIAWEKSTTIENAIKAFKYAGLFPLDESVVLKTAKMEPSRVFSPVPSESVAAKGAADMNLSSDSVESPGVDPSPAQPDTSNPPPVQGSGDAITTQDMVLEEKLNDELEPRHNESSKQQIPPVELPTPSTETSIPKSPSHSDVAPSNAAASSPFSKYLIVPKAETTQKAKPKCIKLPKAITGDAFRKILQDKKDQKEKLEREKQQRKEEREKKKLEREEEMKRKKKEPEEKKAKKALAKERKLKVQEFNKKNLKRKREHSDSESSNGNYSVNDSSEFDFDINSKKCYKCEAAYDDKEPLTWIACSSCPRLFHRRCTDIDFDQMTEDDVENFLFECLFC